VLPCITTYASIGEVLMLGYMNRDTLEKTILTGEAHYWSRSRQVLWHSGGTSGLVQRVVELRIDEAGKTFNPRVVCGDAPNPTVQ